MSTINFDDNRLSINDLRNLIPLVGKDITVVIQSEPGCGKSSLLKMLEDDLGDGYDYIYVDCPVKDMSDIAMTIPNHADKSLQSYVGSVFKMNSPKPKVVMLDEFPKSPKLLQILWTRLMLERCVGDTPLPEGSIVFATGNNEGDGVGDSMLAHAGNRVMKVEMRKPNTETWLPWAAENGISAITRAWVATNERALASYRDGGQEDNELIFHPNRKGQCVSPRSLAKNDINVRLANKLGPKVVKAAMAGTVGPAAAASIATFIALNNELVSIKTVLSDPLGTPVPTKPVALFIMMFNAVDVIETQDDLTKFIQFLSRAGSDEIMSTFYTSILSNKRTVRIAKNNSSVTEWMKKNYVLMG